MKTWILVLALLTITVSANAGQFCGDAILKDFENDCEKGATDTNQVGVGLDIPLYITDRLVVDQETRINYDGDNSVGTYTVFKPVLYEGILQKPVGVAIKGVTGLFNLVTFGKFK